MFPACVVSCACLNQLHVELTSLACNSSHLYWDEGGFLELERELRSRSQRLTGCAFIRTTCRESRVYKVREERI